jgi:hypothetical protein
LVLEAVRQLAHVAAPVVLFESLLGLGAEGAQVNT